MLLNMLSILMKVAGTCKQKRTGILDLIKSVLKAQFAYTGK
jgi:hypothetical protein